MKFQVSEEEKSPRKRNLGSMMKKMVLEKKI